MNLKLKQTASVIFVLIALIGCVTGYQKSNLWDRLGYVDEKIGDGTYRLSYLVSGKTPPEDALKYWHQRAKELCGSNEYDHDEKQTMQNHRALNLGTYSFNNYYFPYVEGTVKCK